MAERERPLEAPPPLDLAGALHDVSNALTVIAGWIERARTAASPDELATALRIAGARAADARSVVRAAIGAEVRAEPARAAGDVIRDAVLSLDPEARRAGIVVDLAILGAAERAPVGDAGVVLQILTNLLLNAIAASPKGARVEVELARASDGGVVVSVHDQGPGVPPERRASLFDAGVSTKAGGAGIGLRYAARLAGDRGGAIALAESDSGARFALRWPAYKGDPSVVDAGPLGRVARAPAYGLEGERVLVLEDDAAVLSLLEAALTARGAEVIAIERREGLAPAIASGRFDAVLFDLSPIAGDVRSAIELVRAASDATRVVLISGSASGLFDVPPEWVSAWVRKPFEINEIVSALAPKRSVA